MFNYPRGKGPKERLNGDSIKRRLGRPPGSGVSDEPTVRSVRVTELVSVMFEDWKRRYHKKTLDAGIRAYVKDHGALRKKLDALERELIERQQVEIINAEVPNK